MLSILTLREKSGKTFILKVVREFVLISGSTFVTFFLKYSIIVNVLNLIN